MNRLTGTLILLLLTALPATADTVDELDQWFRDGYAALYTANAWDRADEFAQYFADDIAYRSNDGLLVTDVDGFVIDSLDEWRSEGWLGTDVASLETRLLNTKTAVFDVRWVDRYDNGSKEVSCGWYVADKIGGRWLLSQYIAMSCDEQDD